MRFILSLTLATASLTFAQTTATPNVADLKTYLTLTDAQVTSLQTIQTQERTAIQTFQTQIQAKHTQLQQALTAGTTAQVAGQLLLDIEALRRQVTTARTQFNGQAVAVLTADQRTKLAALTTAATLREEIQQATALNLIVNTDATGGFIGGPGAGRGAGVAGAPFGGRFRMGPPPMIE